MNWRFMLFVACLLLLSIGGLVVIHVLKDPAWLVDFLPVTEGGDGVLWQVQSTFLSVGFAGLAIAAQLFAEAPLAIGSSRSQVLKYIGVDGLVALGLSGNLAIAAETLWAPSHLGVLVVCLPWFLVTLVMLVVSTVRLMQLFGNPSALDEVVRSSLIDGITGRLQQRSGRYLAAQAALDEALSGKLGNQREFQSRETLRITVPKADRVIKSVRPAVIRQAQALIDIAALKGSPTPTESAERYDPPQLHVDVEIGDRTRLGQTAFRVQTDGALEPAFGARISVLLQRSFEFEPPGAVTPYEETDREIAGLKDSISTALRSGAFTHAERALDLLGKVIRGVWVDSDEAAGASRSMSYQRRDWLFRSITEVELDAISSPRAASLFIDAATSRAIEAPRTGSMDYVDQCLRSFTHIWYNLLRSNSSDLAPYASRVLAAVQNQVAFSFALSADKKDLQEHGVWAMVELVKLALDARSEGAALDAARELEALFSHDPDSPARSAVRSGQMVLAGWVDYLEDVGDERHLKDARFRELITPRGTWGQIVGAGEGAVRRTAPFSKWDWWEMKSTPSGAAQVLQLPHFVDQAQVKALVSSYGRLPELRDAEQASYFQRLRAILDDFARALSPEEGALAEALDAALQKWSGRERVKLHEAPISRSRVDELTTAARETLDARERLAQVLPPAEVIPDDVDDSVPILGMNLIVPKHYMVDEIFDNTYANPADLGQALAEGFVNGEERRIIEALRECDFPVLPLHATAIADQLRGLRGQEEEYILLTPFGGVEDFDVWYAADMQSALRKIQHFEIAALQDEAFLFRREGSVQVLRRPEEKEGLDPVSGTALAIGVFATSDQGDPQVRVEAGEYFLAWPHRSRQGARFVVDEPAASVGDGGQGG